MHRKHVTYVQEGMQPYGRFARISAELDADFEAVASHLFDGAAAKADLVVVSLTSAASDSLAHIQQELQAIEGAGVLFVADEDALDSLRMPGHVNADFVLSTAPDAELLIRMRRLLWPHEEASNSDLVMLDSMVINLSTYQVLVKGEPVDFTYLEYALLAFLVTHSGHVYSRDALLSRVWGFDYFGGSRTVDVHVRRVRSKLGNDLAAHLRTVRGVGYMWE